MATVLEILQRASRITGLRYDGADDTGSEAELLRQALEDVYIDVAMEVNHHERQYEHTFALSEGTQSIERYDEYTSFVLQTDSITLGAAPDTDSLPSSPINPSGVTVTQGATTFTEGTDYTVDASTGQISNVVGGLMAAGGNYDVQYFAPPTLTVNDDIVIPPWLKIRHIEYTQGTASSYPLLYVSTAELLEHRRGLESTGYSRIYSISGDGLINLWPRPAVGDTITVNYIPMPPKLSETDNRTPGAWDEAIWDLSQWDDYRGVESIPSMVPIQFHWNTLLPGVVVQALDKDQRTSDAQLWQARYEAGIAKMHLWAATLGNVEAAPVFDASNPRYVSQWPDQYSRSGWLS